MGNPIELEGYCGLLELYSFFNSYCCFSISKSIFTDYVGNLRLLLSILKVSCDLTIAEPVIGICYTICLVSSSNGDFLLFVDIFLALILVLYGLRLGGAVVTGKCGQFSIGMLAILLVPAI